MFPDPGPGADGAAAETTDPSDADVLAESVSWVVSSVSPRSASARALPADADPRPEVDGVGN